LSNLGFNRIIGLSHHGYKEDIDVATKTKGLSLIVGGHSHTYLKPKLQTDNSTGQGLNSGGFYPTPVINLENNFTYVVQAGCWGRFLGHIDIEFNPITGYIDKIEGTPIELSVSLEQDLKVEEMVAKWRVPFDAHTRVVLGTTNINFSSSRCQLEECALGSLLADIMLDNRPKSDFVFINSGGIRSGLPTGNITVGDIQVMLPFGNALVDIELSGQRVWDFLEAVVSKLNKLNNKPVTSFIQVSGLQFQYDPTAPIQNRLISVKIKSKSTKNYEELNRNSIYTATTIEFLANGGDNIITPAFINNILLDRMDEVVMAYIKSHPLITNPESNRILIGRKPTSLYQILNNSSTNASC